MKPLRIGTRGSRLALWQANTVASNLRSVGIESEIVTVRTTGDKRQDVPLSAVGGKGVFIKELEEALDAGTIDMAVHSLKDVPSIVPLRFSLTSFLKRADPRDAWIHREGRSIEQLREGAIVATSAPRRRAQLLHRFPGLRIEPIRGNVDTRLEKIRSGRFDAIVLASAGLDRLGRSAEITSYFSIDEMIPAAGQGIVVVETMTASKSVWNAARTINDEDAEAAALSERGVLQKFGEQLDCYSAIAVHATNEKGRFVIRAFAAGYDGAGAIRVQHSGPDAESVVVAVYDELVALGAVELLSAGEQSTRENR